ncbi:hypothetical protein ACWD4J_20705 [Streptomyces sp. NPDC002577]
MSTAAFSPSPFHSGPPGASAATGSRHSHRIGDVLRAVRVFASAAFRVIVLGEYAEEAGVHRR